MIKLWNIFVYSILLLLVVSACSPKPIQKNKESVVEPGKTVTFDYAAGFDNGTLFDTTFEVAAKEAGIYDPSRIYQPITIVYGKDPLFPGLQEALLGMKVREIKNLRISPNMAYGEKIEGSTAVLPKTSVSNYETLKINDVITLIDKNNNKINAYVREIGEENVTLDINHPLAGQFVQFSIILRSVE